MSEQTAPKGPHPVVYTILYLPFGALSGFVSVALTFLATKRGLDISEGAMLQAANLLSQWLKWIWAPAVDITLTPRKWYVISTVISGVGVFAMAATPLGPGSLPTLLAIIAIASLLNSIVGMAVESMISQLVAPEDIGKTSAWFQVGNLGGVGLGGALGLYLVAHLAPWIAGLIMAGLFCSCCFALLFTPPLPSHHAGEGPGAAVKGVARDLWRMLKTKGGLLSAIICVMPIGTGAAQVVLTQAQVAEAWGAHEREIELLQGLISSAVTAAGCFGGGWLSTKLKPRTAYAVIGLFMALTTFVMSIMPMNVTQYVIWNLIYFFGVGLAYSAFTALVLDSMGHGSGATKYNVFASFSNFPIWWLGLVLGFVAKKYGPNTMLRTESLFGVLGVLIFAASTWRVQRSKLSEA